MTARGGKPPARAGAKRRVAKAAAKKASAKAKRAKRAKAADPHAAVRRYRERMRAKGLRPVTIWVPDPSDPAVREALAREARAILLSSTTDRDLRPLFDAQDFSDWTV